MCQRKRNGKQEIEMAVRTLGGRRTGGRGGHEQETRQGVRREFARNSSLVEKETASAKRRNQAMR